jgi:alpha,alpha-trehalase
MARRNAASGASQHTNDGPAPGGSERLHARTRTHHRAPWARNGRHGNRAGIEARCARRAQAINTLFWDAGQGIYVDFDWREQRRRRCFTAAALVSMFCGIATQMHAETLTSAVSNRLMAPGGMGTSESMSGEQWDRPNGWAPLQWMAAEGFARYGLRQIASEIRRRWLASVQSLYDREGKLVEKYLLRPDTAHPAVGGGGGEYPLQDGFGWTNGVTRRWLHEEALAK